MLHLTRTRT